MVLFLLKLFYDGFEFKIFILLLVLSMEFHSSIALRLCIKHELIHLHHAFMCLSIYLINCLPIKKLAPLLCYAL